MSLTSNAMQKTSTSSGVHEELVMTNHHGNVAILTPQSPTSVIMHLASSSSISSNTQHSPSSPVVSTSSSLSSSSNLTLNDENNVNNPDENNNNRNSSGSKCGTAVMMMNSDFLNSTLASVIQPMLTTTQCEEDCTSVRVAVRIRPLATREQIELCKVCTYVTPGEPQVTLGQKDDKSFTFDYVFDRLETQSNIFSSCVRSLVDGCFDGYNATVLAYGQTGSGKTYTMGTSFDSNLSPEEEGIIPRAIAYLFQRIEHVKTQCMLSGAAAVPRFSISAQFMELYNEEINDLFAHLDSSVQLVDTDSSVVVHRVNGVKSRIEIHEDQYGAINLSNISTREVRSAHETLEILKLGAKVRTTGATNMNLQSSRSHAIFTLHVKQTRANSSLNQKTADLNGYYSLPATDATDPIGNEFETLTAKFHFVDLAGSERLKRTGATGHRAKEGICINRGLLALGNVISALGDQDKRGSHVPYRDSKLTRLLQDSLGGNSRTLMIACISPSDRDFMETLNTLRYSNRARNIKNKVVVNQDKTSKQIAELKAEIERLKCELIQFKTSSSLTGAKLNAKSSSNKSESSHSIAKTTSTLTIVAATSSTSSKLNRSFMDVEDSTVKGDDENLVDELKQENMLLIRENQNMRMRMKAMQETIEHIRNRNVSLEMKNSSLSRRLDRAINGVPDEINEDNEPESQDITSSNLLEDYLGQIEHLKCKLIESESYSRQLQAKHKSILNDSTNSNHGHPLLSKSNSEEYNTDYQLDPNESQKLIEEAKNDIEVDLINLKKLQQQNGPNNNNSVTSNEDNHIEEQDADLIEEDAIREEHCQQLEKDISDLILKIDIKRRLINELELNSKNLEQMRVHYQEKMSLLHDRIKQVEEERDKIILNMTKINQDNKLDDQIKKIRQDYELKLKNLQADLVKYEQLKAKNAQMIKHAVETEKQLKQFRQEIVDMKKLKVKLMNQLRDEVSKSKQEEQKFIKQIALLKRDHLKKDNQIKNLEAEKKCREIVLKRKQEQIQALRRINTGKVMSDKASGRVPNSNNPTNPSVNLSLLTTAITTTTTTNLVVSAAAVQSTAKSKPIESSFVNKRKAMFQQKWVKIDQSINSIIVKKQAISLIEREMERYLEQREKISRKLNRLIKRLNKAQHQENSIHSTSQTNRMTLSKENLLSMTSSTSIAIQPTTMISTEDNSTTSDLNTKSTTSCFESLPSKIDELKEQIDIMKSNIDYLNDQIAECQTNIIQLGDSKDGGDYLLLENHVNSINSLDEARFVLKKMLILALNKGVVAAQKEHLNNQLESELDQIEKDYNVQQELVQQIINSGLITNEFAQQILSNSCFSEENGAPIGFFNGHLNGGADNFEIDEIILAPVLGDSSSESEDDADDYEMTGFIDGSSNLPPIAMPTNNPTQNNTSSLSPLSQHFNTTKPSNQQNISSSSTSSSSSSAASTSSSSAAQTNNSESMFKARQLIATGPEDLLYASPNNSTTHDMTYSNLDDLTISINESFINRPVVTNDTTSTMIQNHINSNNLVTTSRICSKSYTKIPEMVSIEAHTEQQQIVKVIEVVDPVESKSKTSKLSTTPSTVRKKIGTPTTPKRTFHRTSKSDLHKNVESSSENVSIPMSKSAIVTAADRANFGRMSRSTISRQNSKDSVLSESSPPESPFHKRTGSIRDENVFNRLTSETKQSPMPELGNIKPYSGNTNRFRFSPITLTHVAEGHSKAILSVDAHDFKLFTGSKDRTAKVWDLITGQEIVSLAGHINNVTKIRYSAKSQLCFTVSSYYVKVWDLREKCIGGKCVRTLSSSGLSHEGDSVMNHLSQIKTNSRLLQNEIPFGEKLINDLVVDSTGLTLYTASGSSVKIWDLRQFVPVDKLSGGHSSSITTMLVDDKMIITGSKDHYIKLFELSRNTGKKHSNNNLEMQSFLSSSNSTATILSKHTLTPPHYDGVQSLFRFDNHLFSCSRDMCIKKWDMHDYQCKQSINNAHKDWICSLDYLPRMSSHTQDVLLSGCRGGYLKFWNIHTLEKLADFRAHLCPINSIKCNKNMVFTASDDATVRIWRRDK